MANQYVNKVVYNDAVLIDISDSNALAGDVMSGKTFYLPSGAKGVGTNPGNQIEINEGWHVEGKTLVIGSGGDGDISLQNKTVNPSLQSLTVVADTGYDGLSSVTVNAMPSGSAGTPSASKGTVSGHSVSVTPSVTNTTGYITGGTKTGTAVTVSASELVSGTLSIDSNGTHDVTNYSSVSVSVGGSTPSTNNIQVYSGYDEVNTTSYTATDVSITVSKAGTYKCSWTGLRNTTSGTSGSRLYVNGTAAGSAHTSGWIRSYGCYCEETLTLSANDVLTVYARARATNYYMVVGNLIIEEQ